MGLGLSKQEFWDLSYPEIMARRKVWEEQRRFQVQMFAQLRADIHNGWMPKKQGHWKAVDFGGEEPKGLPAKHPRATLTPEELQRRAIAAWGPDGRATKKVSIVKGLKGTGQPLPKVG